MYSLFNVVVLYIAGLPHLDEFIVELHTMLQTHRTHLGSAESLKLAFISLFLLLFAAHNCIVLLSPI
jgi:hypothetical protein